MINMPPGSAKSTYASVLFPAWLLAQRPRLDVIGASNTGSLAEDFSRRVMALVRDHERTLGYSLERDAAERWSTTNGGQYRAAGVGAVISGRRADLALIDDPVKGREDVEGEGNREKQWAWFTGDLRPRLTPSAAIVVIMTRWHVDDLGGRLLDRQPGLWKVISLPAQAEEENDLLGRKLGEWLWADDDYGYAQALRETEDEYLTAGATRDWAALYQQRPTLTEGSLFKVEQLRPVEAVHAGGQVVRAWDLAATSQMGVRNPDWTVGVKLHRSGIGEYTVLDVARVREGPDGVERVMLHTAMGDGRNVRIGIPQDPGQAGKQQVLHLTRMLSGFVVESSPESGDKATRAAPCASQVNVGNFAYVSPRPWNGAFKDELAGFPGGMKDDQVDALSRAFSMLDLKRPLTVSDTLLQRSAIPRLRWRGGEGVCLR